MRSTFKVLFFVNGSKEKNGAAPIMGRVTINGQVAQFSCKLTIAPSLWDVKGNKAKGKGDEAHKINHALDKIKARIIELYNQIRERENFVTAEMVRNAYQGIGNEYETILRAFDKYNADFAKRVGKDRSPDTLLKHQIVRNHVANFIGSYYKRKDMAMKELTEEFVRQFDIYLRTQVGLEPSTAGEYARPVKMIVTRAYCDGRLHRNPFAQYHISRPTKEQQYLTEDELQRLMSHPLAKPIQAKIRDIFVFGCLTGISFIDIKNLTTDNLETTVGGRFIAGKRQKTGIPFRVKLLDSAYRIIERYEPTRKGGRLFDFPCNSQTNQKLKKILAACGIDKPVTFHQSRHTFGTLAVSKGMPIETVSKILGHSKITTTQIYAKMTNEKIERDMDSFSKKLDRFNRLDASAAHLVPAPVMVPMPRMTRMTRMTRRTKASANTGIGVGACVGVDVCTVS